MEAIGESIFRGAWRHKTDGTMMRDEGKVRKWKQTLFKQFSWERKRWP